MRKSNFALRLQPSGLLDVVPYIFVRVQFGRIGRQKEECQPPVLRRDEPGNGLCPMCRMPIHNHEDRCRCVDQQPLEELDEHRSRHPSFRHHEAKLPLWAGTNQPASWCA